MDWRNSEARAAREFDRWARLGRAESMARGHRETTAHLLGAEEICAKARRAGWSEVRWRQVGDRRPLVSEADFQP